MDTLSLDGLVQSLTERARSAPNGRASETIYGGADAVLRQTVIALLAGQEMGEHESPGQATLQVLSGRVTLRTSGDACEAGAGEVVVIPPERHSVSAGEDSAILLSVAKTGGSEA